MEYLTYTLIFDSIGLNANQYWSGPFYFTFLAKIRLFCTTSFDVKLSRSSGWQCSRPNSRRIRTVFPPDIVTAARSVGSVRSPGEAYARVYEVWEARGGGPVEFGARPPPPSRPSWIRPCAFSSGGMRHVRRTNDDARYVVTRDTGKLTGGGRRASDRRVRRAREGGICGGGE